MLPAKYLSMRLYNDYNILILRKVVKSETCYVHLSTLLYFDKYNATLKDYFKEKNRV